MMDSRAKTARRKIGNRVIPGIVYQWIRRNFQAGQLPTTLLDYGCGYGQARQYLSEVGMNWYGYDLQPRFESWGDNWDRLQDKWDLIPACNWLRFPLVAMSNVLNVQEDRQQLTETIIQAAMQVSPRGYLVWNYPSNPRKMPSIDWAGMLGIVTATLGDRFFIIENNPKQQLAVMRRSY